eukprot:5563269-Pyramimonas_sp.AAC.2
MSYCAALSCLCAVSHHVGSRRVGSRRVASGRVASRRVLSSKTIADLIRSTSSRPTFLPKTLRS